MQKKWLITGGCGFIGTSLIKKLIDDGGQSIRVIDNLSVGTREDLEAVCPCELVSLDNHELPPPSSVSIQLILGDILDDTLSQQVSKDIDIIVHLAASTGVGPSVQNPRADCMNNVLGTFNYLEAARQNRVKRFIFASSGAPAGEVEPPIHEELPPHPVSPYGASKLAGEGYCSAFFKTFGVETVAMRFGNVYGPGSLHKSSVVAKFIKQALAGQKLEIYGDGRQTRDFIYIDDLVAAIKLAAVKSGIGGEVFQIATHTETTVGEMTEKLVKILAKRGIDNVTIACSYPRPGDVKRNYSDTSKARRILGWEPKIGLEVGLARTVAYYLSAD